MSRLGIIKGMLPAPRGPRDRGAELAPSPPTREKPRPTATPGTSVVRPMTGLPPVPPLGDRPWRWPEAIEGTGQKICDLYETGSGPKVYDVALLDELNAEYASRPLVPAPPSYSAPALAASARRRVGWVHDMVDLVGLRTLEIGCGNGFEVWSLAHNLDCDAHGVDVARYRPWEQLAGPRVQFQCTDLSIDNPYEKGSFDRVIAFTVWEHVTHPFALLSAVRDVLRPGGLAWIRANLYAGPQASHRYRDIHFPWPHLLFSDQVVREWDVAHGRRPIGHAWVNRLSWLHYEYYADRLGFEIASRHFTETPIDEDFYARFEDVLGRYPRTDLRRDYVLYVLRKPA
jgi:SAM-dependent methyltransferase